jgi:hypothetical protein
VNPPTPANGIVGTSAPLCLVDGAYSRSDGNLIVIVRDLEHHLLGAFVAHPPNAIKRQTRMGCGYVVAVSGPDHDLIIGS